MLLEMWRSFRSLFRRLSFAATAIGTLALGIGATTAVYSVFDAVLVRPLPFANADRVLSVQMRTQDGLFGVSTGVLAEVQALPAIEHAAAVVGAEHTFRADLQGSEVVRGAAVTTDFFDLVGVPAAVGTAFGVDRANDATPPLVLSNRLWRRRFAADPAIVGQAVRLDAQYYTVVGVMPDRFRFPLDAEYWRLLRLGDPSRASFGPGPLNVLVRLHTADTATAAAQLDVLSASRRGTNQAAQAAVLVPMLAEANDLYGASLRMMLIGAVFVLLIACANVAHLLLANAASRAGELSVRHSLGASRPRLVRHLLMEAGILAAAAGAAGALVSWLLLSALLQLGTLGIPRLDQVTVDWRVFLFTSAVTVASVFTSGFVPAWILFRKGPTSGPQQKATSGPGIARLSRIIVAAEVSTAVVLLAGSLIVLRGLYSLVHLDVGFQPDRLLFSSFRPAPADYPGNARSQLVDQLLEHLRTQPNIESAAVVWPVPLAPQLARQVNVLSEGAAAPSRATARLRYVSDGALHTLGVSLIRGRELTPGDRSADVPSAIINEALARKLWADADPVGQLLTLQSGGKGRPFLVIGVCRNMRGSLIRPAEPELFVSHAEHTDRDLIILARSSLPLGKVQDTMLASVRAVAPGQPASVPRPMRALVADASEYHRFHVALLSVCGGFAVLLACSGILAVVTYAVVRRTREVGIRIALGATPRQVIGLFLRELAPSIGLGTLVGAIGIFNLSGYLHKAGLVPGVSKSLDPVIYALGAAFVVSVAVAAVLIPARAAARVEPVAALRTE
jgi:putative ABC transport system permease protein